MSRLTKTAFVIDLLFSEIDSSRFVSKTYDFYEEILVGYLPYFFDAYDHMDSRQEYKKIAEKIERRIQAIPDENARIQLSRVMFLPLPKFYGGDWTACKTRYSYSDKQFINSLWEKYGQYHLYELITAIYELKIGELLPEVLPSICLSFYKAKEECTDSVENVVSQHETRINALITTAFVEKEDQIKQDSILTESFESLLELLVGYGFEIAAVILDEFRVH